MNNLILIFILIVIYDFTKVNSIWGESFERRMLHHISGGNYNPYKKIKLSFLKKLLDNTTCKNIFNLPFKISNYSINNNLINLFSNLFVTQNSQVRSLYYNDFSENIKIKLDQIGQGLIPTFSKLCGQNLSLSNQNFRACILIYKGPGSDFKFHYDTEPSSYYRCIILISKKGNIPKFSYYNQKGILKTIDMDVGDCIFLKGTQTYHGVIKSDDDYSERYILGFQYKTDKPEIISKSFCSELRGKDIFGILKLVRKNILILLSFLYLIATILCLNQPLEINYYLCFTIILSSFIILISLSYLLYNYLGSSYLFNFKIILIFYIFFGLILLPFGIKKSLIISTILILYYLITEILIPKELYQKLFLS